MVRFFLGEKSGQLYSGLCTSACFVCYDNVYFYALLRDHYLVRLTDSALFSATPQPCCWSHQQRWCQRHGLGPESHQQCRRAGQYQTHPEVFANIFPSCSFITKQNSCWCCVGLEENRQKRPCKSNLSYYLNENPGECDLNWPSDAVLIKPLGTFTALGRFLTYWSSSCPCCKFPTSACPYWYPGRVVALVTVTLDPLLMAVSSSSVYCALSNIFIFSDRSHAQVSV